MIQGYKFFETKNTGNIFKEWNQSVDTINIKNTSTTVGFIPFVNF